jgi:CrcB protein
MLKNYLLVAIGGMTGSLLRYGMSQLVRSASFPSATLLVNLVGSFAIGIILGCYSTNSSQDESLRLLLATGLCGGFTTFSAFSAENWQLIQNGNYSTALLYIAATLLLGIGATAFGFILTKN